LASCYRSALNLAETYGLQSIAFPAISTGVFGYPLQEAAEISLSAVRAFNSYEHLQRIRFVLWSEKELMVFKQMLHRVFA